MKPRNILTTPWVALVLVFAATRGYAANTWTSPTDGYWTNSANWDVGPLNNGTADIVLTNVTAATRWASIAEDWSINGLSFTGGGGDMFVGQTGSRTLFIGAGGILSDRTMGAERWLIFYPKITFTTTDATIGKTAAATWASIQFQNTIDSTAVGGTKIHALTGYNGGYIQLYTGAVSTTNISWSLENSRFAIYANPIDALGSNKLTVVWTGTRTVDRSATIGLYRPGTLTNSANYFDTPIEVDPLAVGTDNGVNLRPLTFVAQKYRTDGGAFTQYVRGVWTSKGSVAITNTQGNGWLQIRGSSADANLLTRTYWQMNSSGLLVNSIASPSWNGDVSLNGSGYNVIDAPHAFGTNNSWSVNISNDNGGLLNERDRYFLATAGNNYSGVVRVYGNGAVSNSPGQTPGTVIRGRAFIGIEGAGSVTFSGPIFLYPRENSTNLVAAPGLENTYDAYLYARSGGTAVFEGLISQNSWAGTAPKVFITGGGTIVMENSNTYTNRTMVMSNTTLRLDGAVLSEIEVLSGSTLMGIGSTSDNLIVGGDVAPGASIGTFTVYGNVDFQTGATLTVELGPGNTSDSLDVLGDLDITLAVLRLVGSQAGTFTIANYGTLTGAGFASVDTTGLGDGYTLDSLAYGTGQGDSISLTVIPEPASILLMLSGIIGAYKLRRRV
jgi:hypothetical protein